MQGEEATDSAPPSAAPRSTQPRKRSAEGPAAANAASEHVASESTAPSWQLALAVRSLMLGADRYRQIIAERHGISVPGVIALGDLYQSGPLTPRSIATRLAWTTGGVTALLDRLERRGFITRMPNPDDRRSILTELTTQGHEVMQQVFELLESAVSEASRNEHLAAEPVVGFLERLADRLVEQADTDNSPRTESTQ